MLATAKRATIVALWLVCCYYDQAATVQRHDHVRTKSSARDQMRIQQLTSDMPKVTVVAGATAVSGGGSSDADADADTDADTDVDADTAAVKTSSGKPAAGHGLRDFLFRRPNKMLKSLMRTSVRVVQRGMDAFQGVSNKVYRVARKQIGGQRAGSSSAASGGQSGGGRTPAKRQADVARKPTGFVKSVAKMLDTGIAGIEQVTDFGLLLGNMGTHKIMAKLEGKSGNQEIFNMLVKYVGSKVGKGAKGSAVQFVQDVGTISTFAATDDDVTNSIATLMEKLMGNPEVSTAMVRLAVTVLDGSPSTSCLLDQLPLSPQDLRMVFDVFVGSNGQIMLKTIAGLVSDLTTGPDTKAFLESALGMMSMFKSDNSGPATAGNNNSDKPTSIVGSLTSFLTGGGDEDEDVVDDDASAGITAPPTPNKRKKGDVGGNAPKPSAKKPAAKLEPSDDSWFSKTSTASPKKPTKLKSEDDSWFSKTSTASPKKPTKLKSEDDSWFSKTKPAQPAKLARPKSDDWFKTGSVDGKEVRGSGEEEEDETGQSGSGGSSFSDELGGGTSKPTTDAKTNGKDASKKSNADDEDDFDLAGDD